MLILKSFIVLVSFCFSSVAMACSFAGAEPFKPTLKRWEKHPGPAQQARWAQKTEAVEGDFWEKVPAPIIKVAKITRGSEAPGSTCADAGTVLMEISLPSESSYSIKDFGIYFRVKSGKLPDQIFPDSPLVGDIKDGKMYVLLGWLDGHPSRQIPLDLEVEAFFVTNSLNIGSSTLFAVTANKG